MVNIIRTRHNSIEGSPRFAEVGEIDTKAPFQSVRAAVSLFGEASSPRDTKPLTKKSKSETEGVLDLEAQFHMALNELNKLKGQIRRAKTGKAETLPELDKAKRTLEDLKRKLKSINDSKQSILEATEALKAKARELEEAKSNKDFVYDDGSGNRDNDAKKEEYKAAIVELDAAKQELSNMRRDFDTALEAKTGAIRKSDEAQVATNALRERVNELSKQVPAMQKALSDIRASSTAALEKHENLIAKKDAELQSHLVTKEEIMHKIIALKKENETLLAANLEAALEEINGQIDSLQAEVKNSRDILSEAQIRMNYELQVAKKALKQDEEEKVSFQNTVDSLKQELELVELEVGLVKKTSAADVSDDMVSAMEQLTLETDKAKQEAEKNKKRTADLENETKDTQAKTSEMESKLSGLVKEIEEAKDSERAAEDKIKVLSDHGDAAQTSTSNRNEGKIRLSKEDYNSLLEKASESGNMSEMKVAAALAHVEALVASQQEAAQKIEAYSKEIEELNTAEEEAFKSAEMAEAATRILEAELHRRHHQEQMSENAQLS